MKKFNSKSIKTLFNEHLSEIYSLLESKSQFNQLQIKINELLDSEELKNNDSVYTAKINFKNSVNNYNRYISTLNAYITGIAVGRSY